MSEVRPGQLRRWTRFSSAKGDVFLVVGIDAPLSDNRPTWVCYIHNGESGRDSINWVAENSEAVGD